MTKNHFFALVAIFTITACNAPKQPIDEPIEYQKPTPPAIECQIYSLNEIEEFLAAQSDIISISELDNATVLHSPLATLTLMAGHEATNNGKDTVSYGNYINWILQSIAKDTSRGNYYFSNVIWGELNADSSLLAKYGIQHKTLNTNKKTVLQDISTWANSILPIGETTEMPQSNKESILASRVFCDSKLVLYDDLVTSSMDFTNTSGITIAKPCIKGSRTLSLYFENENFCAVKLGLDANTYQLKLYLPKHSYTDTSSMNDSEIKWELVWMDIEIPMITDSSVMWFRNGGHHDMVQFIGINLSEIDKESSHASGSIINSRPKTDKVAEFHADHPFVYEICHTQTKAVILRGCYTGE